MIIMVLDCSFLVLKTVPNRSTVPVQCTDHDGPEVLKRNLDGSYIHKTTGGLQLKQAYMIYMYE